MAPPITQSSKLDLLGTAGSTTTGSWIWWPGGKGTLRVNSPAAGWNGATATLVAVGADVDESSQPAGGASTVPAGAEVTFTADGMGNFEMAATWIKIVIATAVPTQPIFARAVRFMQPTS